MKKVLFGITSLTLGGAERVLVDVANELSKSCEVTIFTIYSKGELEKQLEPNVKLKALYDTSYANLTRLQKYIIPIKILLQKNRIYRKYIKKDYDVEIAFLEGPITRLFSSKNEKTNKIAWIHNDISLVFGQGIKSRLKRKIDKSIYSKYKTLVFVSEDNKKSFEKTYPELKNNVEEKVIYNYIDKESIIKKSKEIQSVDFNSKGINFVTVARLVEQKAIDRLIKVHSKLIKNHFLHNFYVIGDGPERKKLENLVKEYNVVDTFHLLGKMENPYPYIKNADYFCLLSNFEGYGMVIEEAKVLEKPIIITDTAAREAIKDYSNSLILENSEKGIYEGLIKIIKGKSLKVKNDGNLYDNKYIINEIMSIL